MKKYTILLLIFSACLPVYYTIIGNDTIPRKDSLASNSDIDSLISHKLGNLESINNYDAELKKYLKNFDIIITNDWETKIVKVKKVTSNNVEYYYPFNIQTHFISREETSQIHYSDGKIDVFNPLLIKKDTKIDANLIVKTEKDWKTIEVALNPNDIPETMVELANVNARFEADNLNAPNDYLEKNALIILKKKTANVQGEILFIVEKNFNRPYGEIPYIDMSGYAYGHENE